MGERGKQPETNIKLLVTPKQWPSPPVGMTRAAQTIWKTTTKAYSYDFFKPQHYALLRMYCEAAALNKKALHEAMMANYTDKNPRSGVTKESHWVGIADKMAGRAQSLATKLGITKNNTTVARGEKGNDVKPKSKRAGLLGGLGNEN